MSLKGKVALITGASQLPGSAVAVALARAGVKVAVEGAAGVQERVLRTVETFGGDALPVRGDVVNESDVNHILSNVEAILGPVDILVNASGAPLSKPVEDTSAEEWDKTVNSRARAAFLCARAVVPGMKERKDGRVISIGSAQTLAGASNRTALSASEHALGGFSHALAQELTGSGVRVSMLIPDGPVDEAGGIHPDQVADGVVHLAGQTTSAVLVLMP